MIVRYRFEPLQFVRVACLENVARAVLEAMRADASIDVQALKVDGGMTAIDPLMQFQADLLGTPVTRLKFTEPTAQGAAYAAGLSVGFWNDTDDLRSNWKAGKMWKPLMSEQVRNRSYSS